MRGEKHHGSDSIHWISLSIVRVLICYGDCLGGAMIAVQSSIMVITLPFLAGQMKKSSCALCDGLCDAARSP